MPNFMKTPPRLNDPAYWLDYLDELIPILTKWRSHLSNIVESGKIDTTSATCILFLEDHRLSKILKGISISQGRKWLTELKDTLEIAVPMSRHLRKKSEIFKKKLGDRMIAEGIRKLPSETIVNIFMQGADFPNHYSLLEPTTFLSVEFFSLKISHVSRYFRDLALSTPALWNKMTNCRSSPLYKLFLQRCEGHTVTFFLDMDDENYWDKFSQFSQHCTNHLVDLTIAPDFSSPKDFGALIKNLPAFISTLNVQGDFHDIMNASINIDSPLNLPNLRTLQGSRLNISVLFPTFWNLDHIRLSNCHANTLLSLLSATASGMRIRSASFHYILPPDGALLDLHANGPTVVSGLEFLLISALHSGSLHTLSRSWDDKLYLWTIIIPSLIFPDLKRLHLVESITELLIDSIYPDRFPKLETIEIREYRISKERIRDLFAKFKSLLWVIVKDRPYDPVAYSRLDNLESNNAPGLR